MLVYFTMMLNLPWKKLKQVDKLLLIKYSKILTIFIMITKSLCLVFSHQELHPVKSWILTIVFILLTLFLIFRCNWESCHFLDKTKLGTNFPAKKPIIGQSVTTKQWDIDLRIKSRVPIIFSSIV